MIDREDGGRIVSGLEIEVAGVDGFPVATQPRTRARRRRNPAVPYTREHGRFLAFRLTIPVDEDAAMSATASSARIELMPHQVDAAIFALNSPLKAGAILGDEVGLGKTIEAGLVIAQKWAKAERRILIVAPSFLTPQWQQELGDRFDLPSEIITIGRQQAERRNLKGLMAAGKQIAIMSYERAAGLQDLLQEIPWDLIVLDEAHYLRNVDQSGGKRAKTLREAFEKRRKLLLTATPIQNRIGDILGLLSFLKIDLSPVETLDQARAIDRARLEQLREVLEPHYVRELRTNVTMAGVARFTKRQAVTLTYDPTEDECHLYSRISDYLIDAGADRYGRNTLLMLMNGRKMLGSSVAAVLGFLRGRRRQLEEMIAARRFAAWEDDRDIDAVPLRFREALAEEPANDATGLEIPNEMPLAAPRAVIRPEVRLDEVSIELRELGEMIAIGERIELPSKTRILIEQLPALLDDVVARGGNRKALIFTESKRTQAHLRDVLNEHGFAGQIVLLNGQNSDQEARAILPAWRAARPRAEWRDVATDMRAALVDAFRGDKTIMIATEAGAQGLNLQHCSLVINFDLHWNPQRVEQRIGRCHRFGQKLDVAVVNLVDRTNAAEVRLLELLTEKFGLFKDVFGASDDILGTLAQTFDIEHEIYDILSRCRSSSEVNEAFDALEALLADSIAVAQAETRQRMAQTFDPSVVAQIAGRKEALDCLADQHRHRLALFIRANIPVARFATDDPLRFDHGRSRFHCDGVRATEQGFRHARLGVDGLFSDRVRTARGAVGPKPRHLTFQVSDAAAFGTTVPKGLAALAGHAGWYEVIVTTATSELWTAERLTVVAVRRDGTVILPDIAECLFDLPVGEAGRYRTPTPRNQALQKAVARATDADVQGLTKQRDAFLRRDSEERAREFRIRHEIRRSQAEALGDRWRRIREEGADATGENEARARAAWLEAALGGIAAYRDDHKHLRTQEAAHELGLQIKVETRSVLTGSFSVVN
jgi:hypothetical protein